ncbi:aminoglycoside phosphotransferase family protein [Conexibacter sp. DBS9H8]|uniref:aminoglycoside phosphotransferase family protein n=1 Tax=Conexibacter sp. DBS9H8 TaxID=2937801 RepID=UPI00200F8267|nr:aminoglycoside phosphotransferase family protein [Conexibacter sp. DBS9H8]MDA8069179.1 phosphotransferase [Actinomycetota bacterium]
MLPPLPDRLRTQFLGLIGEGIGPWIDGLPDLVARLCRDWDVELQATLDDGWSAYVASGVRHGQPVVFKVVPQAAEGRAEIAGLLARDGRAVPTLLCHDLTAPALLLRHVPGRAPTQGELSARGVAGLLSRLHLHVERPPAHAPQLIDRLAAHWQSRLTANRPLPSPLPDRLVADAAASVERLCGSWPRPVLVHGDFEARNILRSDDDLIAIDSPAAVGDPGYDAACWILSEHDGNPDALRHRTTELADALDYPTQRIWQWAWPLAVDELLDKLDQPGWSQQSIHDALTLARTVAPTTVLDCHSAPPAELLVSRT